MTTQIEQIQRALDELRADLDRLAALVHGRLEERESRDQLYREIADEVANELFNYNLHHGGEGDGNK